MLADTNINTNNTNDRGTHLTQSPWNPVRFNPQPRDEVARVGDTQVPAQVAHVTTFPVRG